MEHLVILKPRFLEHILSGKKKIECRLSRRRTVPFEAVRAGDLLWLKRVSGPIVAQTTARRVWSFELTSAKQRASIVKQFGDALAAPGWLEGKSKPPVTQHSFNSVASSRSQPFGSTSRTAEPGL